MKKTIKLGIVGLGRAGFRMHLEELEGKEDMFEITAVCDIIEERKVQTAKIYNCKSYATIEDLIKDDNIDIVDIATRSCDHFKHAKIALLAGKTVFLEKPMCETYEEALELIKITQQPNAPKLYIRHNRRFEANFEKVKDIIKSGILGNVFQVNLNRVGYSRRDDWQTLKEFGGGQLLNWGPHIIDHSLRFVDGKYISMFSDLKHTVAAGDCEDHINISFKGENGILVNMQISGGMVFGLAEYYVYGSKGSLEIDKGKIKMKYIDPAQIINPPVADPGTPYQSFGTTGTFAPKEIINWIEETIDCPKEDLSIIWVHLYESFVNNKTFPISLEESAMVMKVITDAKKNGAKLYD